MMFTFFKQKLCCKLNLEPINLSKMFDEQCSLSIHKPRSPETKKLAKIIKQNSTLHYNDNIHARNIHKLSQEQLKQDLKKIENILNGINEWLGSRKDKSERVKKIKDYEKKVVGYYHCLLLELDGRTKNQNNQAAAATSAYANVSVLKHKFHGLIIALPFMSQIFDSMPDLLGLIN